MTRIVVFDLADHERDALAAWTDAHSHVDVVATADGLSDATIPLCAGADAVSLLPLGDLHDPALYGQLQAAGVRVIAMRMAGFNYVLPGLAREHGITVTNVPAYSPQAVAEMALLMLLRLNRRLGTPHVAFFTDIAVRTMLTFGLDNALAVATGHPLPNGGAPDVVN